MKSYDQKVFGAGGTQTSDHCIWHGLTLEPSGKFQSENSLEFSAKTNGTTSDNARVF